MRFTTLSALTALTSIQSVSADFLLTNSSFCMGAFPFNTCKTGPILLTGTSNTTDFTCDRLLHAEDNYYTNGTVALNGDPFVHADDGCGHGKLKFTKDGYDGAYFATDAEGEHVADCVVDDPGYFRKCNDWVGGFMFSSAYRCTSSLAFH